MTAYPEKIQDLEHVFEQMAPQPAAPSSGRPASPEATDRTWRVVGADGFATDCGLPADSDPLRSRESANGTASTRHTPAHRHTAASSGLGAVVVVEPGNDSTSDRSPPANGSLASDSLTGQPTSPKSPLPPQGGSGRPWDIDSQLARIIDTWPVLPRPIQVAMLAMVEAVKSEQR